MKKLLLLFPIAAGLLRVPAAAQTVYTNPLLEESDAYIAGNPFQRDLLLFVDLLRTTHPAFCTGEEHPFDADSLARAEYAAAADCTSPKALEERLQRIAARLHDGHTRIAAGSKNPNVYPFGVFPDGDDLRLAAVAREHEASLGKIITAINDRPAAEVLDGFRAGMSCDNEEGFRRSAGSLLSARDAWQRHPCDRTDSLLRLTFADGKSIELKPCPRKACDMAAVPRRKQEPVVRQTKDAFAYTLLPEKRLCYLFFNSCIDQDAYRMMYRRMSHPITEEVERKLQELPRFNRFLEEMFARMEEEGVTTLVVDLRSNRGGNSRLCDQLLAWLRPHEELRRFTSAIRLSPLWAEQYPEPARQMREAFAEADRRIDPDRLYASADLDFGTKQAEQSDPERTGPLFRGRVVVVQSARTYSSAGILATMIADNGIGTLIGEPGTFRPTHFGDILNWKLPHTGIRGSVSHKLFRRPDRSRDAESSLRPDATLPLTWDDFLQGTDVFQQWILENL